ncbi:MAG: glycine C-acetyltransferase [Candidatus Doudnabacteria bacterium CG10_big_fil_rev_8_21_14_0_10_42_18]|uniref:2-amino-3-ketobutyrate coenzyme A ligase n=1 Tax=Candidatus Doudnabacteria bacterium CG10_big_fil_rev_8_21_14_0_10_42_18 TaxID=1974552 RepID=A0A2H0VAD7_9BACT|nr:MAG: glycine C-acetyltransferase [Candidatus Doudnabacteria bacterium CG10_big_fil_rev_8_21_14_0_10_42_18]
MFSNIKQQFEEELKSIKEAGTWKEEWVLSSVQGAEIEAQGKKLLNFCANNYLGLASSDELVMAAIEGVKKYGYGMASVRFICGTSTIHKDLEKEVAKFFGTEDAILYTSCFDANTGLFETILTDEDAILSDQLNHASIIDGVRLCKAERYRYEHSDMENLEAKLKEASGKRRKLIATDGVFSMDGETAKIKEICDLAEKYGAMVMVDDSHGSGVLGENGRGAVEGLMDRVDILTSTFGKALGGAGGGFTAGRKEIIDVLRQRSRTTLFSNALPPMIASAALYVLQNFDSSLSHLRKQLVENTSYFREKMEKLGFKLGGDGRHSITPVMLYEERVATDMADKLFEKGIYVKGFTFPVVPKGTARIRVQISAVHTKEQMNKTVAAFEEAGKEFGILK